MNKEALSCLRNLDISNADYIVNSLVAAGILEASPLSEPERIAQAAKDWVGSAFDAAQVFGFATGWSTEAWETVLDEKFEHDLSKQKNVFAALVLLAKEGGVEL